MKHLFTLIAPLLFVLSAYSADQSIADSIRVRIKTAANDSVTVYEMVQLARHQFYIDKSTAFAILDSIDMVALKSQKRRLKAKACLQRGVFLIYSYELDSGKCFLDSARQMLNEDHDHFEMANILVGYGLYFKKVGEYYSGIYQIEKAQERYQRIGNCKGRVSCFTELATLNYYLGNLNEALRYSFEGLKLAESLNEERQCATILNNISAFYHGMQKHDKAITYQLKAKDIDEKINNAALLFDDYLNLGQNYAALGQTDKAFESYKQAELYIPMDDSRFLKGALWLSYTELYLEVGMTEVAQKYAQEALVLAGDNKPRLLWVYGVLAMVDQALNQPRRAVKRYLLQHAISKELGRLKDQRFAALYLSRLLGELKDYKSAWMYEKEFNLLSDSLLNNEKVEEIAKAEMKYKYDVMLEREQAEAYAKQLVHKAEMKRQKYINGVMFVLVAVILLVAGLGFYIFRLIQQRKNESLREKLYLSRQQTLSQQMNPHFIFNTLNSIQYFINANNNKASLDYLGMFANLMRKMLNNSQQTSIPLKDEVEVLKTYVKLEALRFSEPFEFNVQISSEIDENQMSIPPFLIQPLIENAIKHGLKQKTGSGRIQLIVQLKGETLVCIVEDNGVGLSASQQGENKPHVSLGTNLINQRLVLLSLFYKQDFYIHTKELNKGGNGNTGTRVELYIPLIAEG